jgi:hypothetical protein
MNLAHLAGWLCQIAGICTIALTSLPSLKLFIYYTSHYGDLPSNDRSNADAILLNSLWLVLVGAAAGAILIWAGGTLKLRFPKNLRS